MRAIIGAKLASADHSIGVADVEIVLQAQYKHRPAILRTVWHCRRNGPHMRVGRAGKAVGYALQVDRMRAINSAAGPRLKASRAFRLRQT